MTDAMMEKNGTPLKPEKTAAEGVPRKDEFPGDNSITERAIASLPILDPKAFGQVYTLRNKK